MKENPLVVFFTFLPTGDPKYQFYPPIYEFVDDNEYKNKNEVVSLITCNN